MRVCQIEYWLKHETMDKEKTNTKVVGVKTSSVEEDRTSKQVEGNIVKITSRK